MRILQAAPYYPPDLGPSAPMLEMLAEDQVARGHAGGVQILSRQTPPRPNRERHLHRHVCLDQKTVTLGQGCPIGAGSVVTRDIPLGAVAAGNPARPVRDGMGYI